MKFDCCIILSNSPLMSLLKDSTSDNHEPLACTELSSLYISRQIMISKVFLVDLVMSATKDALTFNSGVKMGVLGTLHYIKISRWDQTIKEEDYPGVVKFVAKCTSLQKARSVNTILIHTVVKVKYKCVESYEAFIPAELSAAHWAHYLPAPDHLY